MIDRPPAELWTVGHSTLPPDGFLTLLAGHGIKAVADVRRFPASRRYPHFNAPALAASLAAAGIVYVPFPDLGGRRQPRADSPNTNWRNASFRGYADYMETEEFRTAADRLAAAAREQPTAVMCAEALWWRCHRALIADLFKASGTVVRHIMGPEKFEVHPYTAAARIEEGRLTYRGVGG